MRHRRYSASDVALQLLRLACTNTCPRRLQVSEATGCRLTYEGRRDALVYGMFMWLLRLLCTQHLRPDEGVY